MGLRTCKSLHWTERERERESERERERERGRKVSLKIIDYLPINNNLLAIVNYPVSSRLFPLVRGLGARAAHPSPKSSFNFFFLFLLFFLNYWGGEVFAFGVGGRAGKVLRFGVFLKIAAGKRKREERASEQRVRKERGGGEKSPTQNPGTRGAAGPPLGEGPTAAPLRPQPAALPAARRGSPREDPGLLRRSWRWASTFARCLRRRHPAVPPGASPRRSASPSRVGKAAPSGPAPP